MFRREYQMYMKLKDSKYICPCFGLFESEGTYVCPHPLHRLYSMI